MFVNYYIECHSCERECNCLVILNYTCHSARDIGEGDIQGSHRLWQSGLMVCGYTAMSWLWNEHKNSAMI
jgi:hypothetical protein